MATQEPAVTSFGQHRAAGKLLSGNRVVAGNIVFCETTLLIQALPLAHLRVGTTSLKPLTRFQLHCNPSK